MVGWLRTVQEMCQGPHTGQIILADVQKGVSSTAKAYSSDINGE